MSLTGDIDTAVTEAAAPSANVTEAPASSTPAPPGPSPAAASPPGVTSPVAPSKRGSRVPTPAHAVTAPPVSATATPTDDAALLAQIDTGNVTGAIPPDRLKSILTNARAKEADRLVKEVYGFAPADFARLGLRQSLEALDKNPVQFVRALTETLVQRGLMAAPTATPPTAAPSATVVATKPAPDLRAEDGTLAYSAGRMEQLLQWQMGEFEKKITAQLQPVDDWKRQTEHERIQVTAQRTAETQFKDAQQWPGFKEHQAEIYAEAKRLMDRDGRFTLEGAYNKVLRESYLPALKARQRAELIAEIQAAAPQGATTVSPSVSPRGASGRKARGADWDSAIERALDQIQ